MTKNRVSVLFKGRLHGEFQPGLKFSCDHMANFSPVAMFETGQETFVGKRFTFTTQAVRMPKFKLSLRNHKRLFKKIYSGSGAEISARLTGLKFAM